jgi:hypothetical protein
MQRAEPKERFVYEAVKAEGEILRQEIDAELKNGLAYEVISQFEKFPGITFLTDRDEEIWTPLAVIANVFGVAEELGPVAMDMAMEKTARAKKFVDLGKSEEDAETAEYSVRLLKDLHSVVASSGRKSVSSVEAVDMLRAMPVAPWRKFRGDGITINNIATMLSAHGVFPKLVRVGKTGKGARANSKPLRGYAKIDLDAAVARL